MYNVVIAIPTFKRPEMLKKLIYSITECKINKNIIENVKIIVVDNDKDKTAKLTTSELMLIFQNTYDLKYCSYSIKGLSNVRNHMLKKSLELEPDFIVFIDDDEFVTSEWLNELVKTMINTNADAARGPVFAILDNSTPKNIACWFKREEYTDDIELNTLSTGNLILRVSSLQKHKVWFDNRFNYTGSEDSYFGIQLKNDGAKFYWSARAIAYETIPTNRSTLKWLINRNFREASTYTSILKMENEHLKLIKKTLISLLYLFLGCCALILVILPLKKKYWGILKLSEGIGGISGLVNSPYQEYK